MEPDSPKPPGRKLLLWSRRVTLALAALLAVVAAAGAVYQIAGERRDARRFPQRGRSVQAGLVRLNLDCAGQARPAVILDSGMGVPAIGWSKVQPEVAKFARVCSYDRAGYGWSDPGPKPRTSLRIATELKALLEAAGESGPYILVGHSFGGFNVRVYNSLYPGDVAGVVLVDASHEDEDERIGSVLPTAVRKEEKENDEREQAMERVLAPILIHLGIERFAVAAGWADIPSSLPRDLVDEFVFLQQQGKFRNAVFLEDEASPQSVAQVRSAGKLGDRPLVVLTAGKPYEPEPLLTRTDLEKQRNIWINQLQAEEARLSTRGRQIVVPDSSHMIPFERPDAVVSAIHEVWCAVARVAP